MFRLLKITTMEKKKINLEQFRTSSIEVQKLLEVKGGSGSCVTGSPGCVTSVSSKDGDTKSCDTYIC